MPTFTPDPGTVIEQGKAWMIVINRNQNLLGKVMLVLSRDCDDVRQLKDDEWLQLHRDIGRVTSALNSLFEPDHYNYSFLMNVDRQVHLNVIPRYEDQRAWRGLTFDDPYFGQAPPTDTRQVPDELLSSIVDSVRGSLES